MIVIGGRGEFSNRHRVGPRPEWPHRVAGRQVIGQGRERPEQNASRGQAPRGGGPLENVTAVEVELFHDDLLFAPV